MLRRFGRRSSSLVYCILNRIFSLCAGDAVLGDHPFPRVFIILLLENALLQQPSKRKEEAPISISVLASPAPRGSNTDGYYRSGSDLDAGYQSYSISVKTCSCLSLLLMRERRGGKDARHAVR